MPRHHLLLLSGLVVWSSSLQAQSLGEIARQAREKKNVQQQDSSNASATKRVYTNDDMPKSLATSPATENKPGSKPRTSSTPKAEDKAPTAAAEIEKKIKQEKGAIVSLQQDIDELQSTIHYVQNNRNIYVNAPEYNAHQKAKEQEVAEMKNELEQHKRTLSELQEKARQAGLGNSVYQ